MLVFCGKEEETVAEKTGSENPVAKYLTEPNP